MLEMQGAIGRIQLGRMAEWTRKRTINATILHNALAPFAGKEGIIRLNGWLAGSEDWSAGSVHAFYKYYAYVRPDNLAPGWSRDHKLGRASCRERVCQYV